MRYINQPDSRSGRRDQTTSPQNMNSTFLIPSLDDPLSMFARFHQRTREHCSALEKLATQVHEVGVDMLASNAAQRDMAAAVMQFFDHDARLHHEDEEVVFFPMLRALKIDPDEQLALGKVIQILFDDHRLLEQAWHSLRRSLQAISEGKSSRVSMDTATFTALYRHHMNGEETGLIPLAQRYFDPPAIEALRQALGVRRVGRGDAG